MEIREYTYYKYKNIDEESWSYLILNEAKNLVNELMSELGSLGYAFYKKDIHQDIQDRYSDKFDDKLPLIALAGGTDVEMCNDIMKALSIILNDVKKYADTFISGEDNIKIYFLWEAYYTYYRIYADYVDENNMEKIVVPEGTTIIMDTDNVLDSVYSGDNIENKLRILTSYTGNISDDTFNKVVEIVRHNNHRNKRISTDQKQLILPYSVEVIDKGIFNWVNGIKEIVCYKHQLEEVTEAVNYNRQRIEEHEQEMLDIINGFKSRRVHRDKVTSLEEFKDIKITVLDEM